MSRAPPIRFKPGQVIDDAARQRGGDSDSDGSGSDSDSHSGDSGKYDAADSVFYVLLGKATLATRGHKPRTLRSLAAGDVIYGCVPWVYVCRRSCLPHTHDTSSTPSRCCANHAGTRCWPT